MMINNTPFRRIKDQDRFVQDKKDALAECPLFPKAQLDSQHCEIGHDLGIGNSKFPVEYVMLTKEGLVRIAEIYNHQHLANIQIALISEADATGTTQVLKNPQIFRMIEETKAAYKDASEEVRKCFIIGNDNTHSHKIAILYIMDPRLKEASGDGEDSDVEIDNEFLIIMDSQSSKREDVSHFLSFCSYRYLPQIFQSDSYSCGTFSLEFALATTRKSQGKFDIPDLVSFFSSARNVGSRGDLTKLPHELIFLSQKSAVNRSFFDDEGVLLHGFDDHEAQKADGKTFTDHAYLRIKSMEYKLLLSKSDRLLCAAM